MPVTCAISNPHPMFVPQYGISRNKNLNNITPYETLSAAQMEFGSHFTAVQVVCKNAVLEINEKYNSDKLLLSSAAAGFLV